MTNPGLTDDELTELNDFLLQVDEGKIPNPEALDGFFAALACCPDLIKPSEYLSKSRVEKPKMVTWYLKIWMKPNGL
jgi:hypothetical protein